MTSRGNQSVSPPAQISQQRHVNAISSSTPPPQPFYPGPPSTLSQGAYEFLPQAHGPFNPYQAYGSSLSDTRGQPGNGGRGVPNQQNQGNNYYQQPGPNIRPQQAQQSHTYYITAQPQANMRHPRPPHQSPMMFISQNFTPGNSVITVPGMYPSARVPMYPPNAYVPGAPTYPNYVYYQNGAPGWRGPALQPAAAPAPRLLQREKKVLSIQDPETGRDVTEELLNSKSHSVSAEDHDEMSTGSPNDKEICQTFTRLVADRLKSPDDSNASGASSDPHGAAPSTPTSAAGVPSSQQHHPPAPQHPPSSIAAATGMRLPAVGTHIIPAAHSGTPPQTPTAAAAQPLDAQHQVLNVNLSMPPPQFPLRQPTPTVYNTALSQQHPHHSHHTPRHTHSTPQQHPVRPSGPPVIQSPPQPPQPQHQPPPHVHDQTPSSVADPAPQPHRAEPKPSVEATSQDNIPAATPTGPPASSTVTPALKAVPQSVEDTGTKPSPVKSVSSEEPGVIDRAGDNRVETSQGVISQGMKDARKNKKGKKDFTRKEIGGSDMDAFIDKVVGASSGSGENITRTNNALDVASEAGSSGAPVQHSGQKVSVVTEAKSLAAAPRVPEGAAVNVPKHVPAVESSGVSSGGVPLRDEIPQRAAESQKQAAAVAPVQVQNDAMEVDEKPSPSQLVIETKHVDKPASEDTKTSSVTLPQEPSIVTKTPVSTVTPAAPDEAEKKVVPTLLKDIKTPVPTVTPAAPNEAEKQVVPTLLKEIKTEAAAAVTTSAPTAASITTPTINQNQPPVEQTFTAPSHRRAPGQTDRPISKPVENGITDDIHAEPVPTISVNAASDSSVGHYPFIDGSESLESDRKQRSEDIRKGRSLGSSSSSSKPVAARPSAEMTQPKNDGKEKLQYDRAYLMELRECATSQAKPEGLPNLEIILDRPVTGISRGSTSAPLDFTPAFFQQSASGQRHAPPISKSNSRNRPRSEVQMPQRVITSVSLQGSVKLLHQSEKPWKPSPKQLATGEIQEKSRNLESSVLFIMNRLTPTNFEKLAVEMKALNISTYEDLQELVKIFFDKVTIETKFVEAYALLCKIMSGLRVPPPADSAIKESQATFRVVMLTKCQQEFEADKTVVFEDPEEKKKKIEAEMPEGPERTEKIENTLYQMKLKRLKFYGNIRFIGELFKLNMLTENIMHDCIYRLLKARDDDSLVSLCNLISTVGHALDTDKAKTRMDQYFAQMAKIAEERKSRIKFTLRDAIELRNNGWKLRKEQIGPKKLDDVHSDYQAEQATKQFLQSQPLPPRVAEQQPNSRRGSRQRQDENKPTDDGWNTVGSKSLRIDASKMKLSKNVVDENSIQLGPGGGMKQFSMWGKGSYGGTQPSQDNERSSAPANRFSALRGEEDHRSYQRSPSRGDSSSLPNRNMRQGPPAGHGRGKSLARSSQEGDRRDALASARSIVGGRSQNSSRDNSWNREDRRSTLPPRGSRERENVMTRSDISLQPNTDPFLVPAVPPPVAATAVPEQSDPELKIVKPLTAEEMEFKAKTILEEYLSVLDLKEAKLCLRELRGQQYLHVLVTACVNEVLERSNKDRDLTGSFFNEMVKHGQLPMDIYLRGLSDVLQYAEDMVIDIPMMWTYLAQVILPMLTGGMLPWSSLPATLKPSLGERGSAKLLAEILQLAKDKIGEAEVALMWQTNGLVWTDFLPADEVDRFLKDKKLEFTVSQVAKAAARVPVPGQAESQQLVVDIERIVREKGTSGDISNYLNTKVQVDKQDRQFVRSLVTALVNASISPETMKFSEDFIKTHKGILQKFITNPDMELQALYAIQALMHKLEHPSGVIANVFDVLYDEEVISDETFKKWERSSDPLEAEGKGACSMQLTQFFTWLQENEEVEAS